MGDHRDHLAVFSLEVLVVVDIDHLVLSCCFRADSVQHEFSSVTGRALSLSIESEFDSVHIIIELILPSFKLHTFSQLLLVEYPIPTV